MAIADVPLLAPDQHDKHFKEDVQTYVDVIIQDLLAIERRLEEIRRAQVNDPLYQEVALYCREGWPEKGQIKGLVEQHYPVSSKVSIVVEEQATHHSNYVAVAGVRTNSNWPSRYRKVLG